MRTPNEAAILTIKKCASQMSRKKNIFGWDLRQKSYYKWALNELIYILKSDDKTPPLILIEEFLRKMDHYSVINSDTSYMFSCAKDATEWVIDTLIS